MTLRALVAVILVVISVYFAVVGYDNADTVKLLFSAVIALYALISLHLIPPIVVVRQ